MTARRAGASRLVVLAAAWAAFFLLVDVRGDFPLNDDFQYADCARRWLSGGGLRPPEWALSSAAVHSVLGALATAPWGASDQALRVWMIVVGWLGAAGVYVLARRWKASPDAALMAAASMAFSPLYAALSASFHLDVACAALTTAALLAFLRGRESGSAAWLGASSVLVAASGLSRQTGFLCAAGGAAALALERRLTARAALALLAPAGAAAAGLWLWARLGRGPTWAWASGAYAPAPAAWARPETWLALGRAANASLQTCALLLSPLAAAAVREAWREEPGRAEKAALAAVGLAGLAGFIGSDGLPLLQNTLSRRGLGVVVLNGAAAKECGWWASPWLWRAIGIAALASSLTLVRVLARVLGDPERRAALLFAAAPFGAALLMPVRYDRYLLMLLPVSAALAAAGRGEAGRRLLPAASSLAALAAFSFAGLSDYFAWNRARWTAAEALVARGTPPGSIENGFDWDGRFTLEKNLKLLLESKPAREIGIWEWMTLNKVVAATSFSEVPPFPDWELIGRFPYKSPLAGAGEVRLFADPRAYGARR